MISDTGIESLMDLESIRHRLLGDGHITAAARVEGCWPIGEGQSNLTFCLDLGERKVVVRRPPPPPYHPSAHDVLREARIVEALAGTAVPVPRVLAVLDDRLDGVPVVVTEHLDGDVVTDEVPHRLGATPVAGLCRQLAEVLANVHAVPTVRFDGVIQRSARPYLPRQLDRYGRLSTTSFAPHDRGLAASIEAQLRASMPQPVEDVLVHGDLRLGNVLWAPTSSPLPKIGAVFDWELATLGDPDADLAYLLMTHPGADWPANPISNMAAAIKGQPNLPSHDQLAAWYEHASGRRSRRRDWFAAFVLWRASVGLEFFRQRHHRGEIDSNPWLASLDAGIPDMLEQARRLLREDSA